MIASNTLDALAIQAICDQIKALKVEVLSNLNKDYVFSNTPDCKYNLGSQFSYSSNTWHKKAIDNWVHSAKSIILVHCYNNDLYKIIRKITDRDIYLVTLSQFGYQENDSITINSQKLPPEESKKLVFIVSEVLKEIYINLGLKKVLSHVVPRFGENSPALIAIKDYGNLDEKLIYLAPLEHSIYLIKYFMQHHENF